MSKITVVMSVFRESNKELQESISSILNQSYRDFNFIIVDDNPKSNRIKNYLTTVEKQYNNVRLLVNTRNLGAALARNRGVKHAHSKYVAIMDADDIADKCRLECQLLFLQHYHLDFVFPNYRVISFNGYLLKKQSYNIRSMVNQSKLYYIFSNVTDIGINSGWLIKRKVFLKLNGYRNVIIEDYDFIVRAIIKGYRLGYQSNVLMSVRYRNNSIMRRNVLKSYLAAKNLRYFSKRKYICSIKYFNDIINRHISNKKVLRFNRLLLICHNLKYNFNIKYFFKLIYYLLTTRYSIRFILHKLLLPVKMKKIL